MSKSYWLAKSEPSVYSIDDLEADRVTYWDGVRNYQARNNLKEMKVGDFILFYHSNADPIGVAGVAKVSKGAYPDPTQFDKRSKYFDPKASKENPRWFCPDIQFVKKFKEVITLAELKEDKKLKDMLVIRKGQRLSVQAVAKKDYDRVLELAEA